jgi:hypothetical protein
MIYGDTTLCDNSQSDAEKYTSNSHQNSHQKHVLTVHYIRGSKELRIGAGSYAQVIATDPKENLVTVQKPDGERVTYDPSRLRGICAYREIEREFAVGDRIQLTAPNHSLGVANRDIGPLQRIEEDGRITIAWMGLRID